MHPARKEEKLLSSDATYIIVGGTSGIGLDIASWMPTKGARNLVLVSRSGSATELAQSTIQGLTQDGVTVEVCRSDISNQENVEQNLAPLLSRMPPVRGVVYGAMVLKVSPTTFLSGSAYTHCGVGHAFRETQLRRLRHRG